MNHAIILAGGSGTRFWPLSRQNEPKQFLRIYSDRPMIEETIKRIKGLIKKDNIYIATNKIHYKKIKDCLKNLLVPPENIFFEPQGKNTLAPIGVLSSRIYSKDKKATIAVLPSDHYIKDESRFLRMLEEAVGIAQKGFIVTFGIKPDRPETGYGYIKVKPKLSPKGAKSQKQKVYPVDRFIEKPSLVKAKGLIKDKSCYWNCGIFIFRPDTVLGEIKKFALGDYKIINRIKDQKTLNRFWPQLTSISIDYAVMEKTKKLALMPADFGWVDLGSWQAIELLAKKDKSGNIFNGNCIDVGSRNTLAWSDNRLLATVGLNNVIVVNTKDAILVCAKDKTQDVREVVGILKQKKLFKQI